MASLSFPVFDSFVVVAFSIVNADCPAALLALPLPPFLGQELLLAMLLDVFEVVNEADAVVLFIPGTDLHYILAGELIAFEAIPDLVLHQRISAPLLHERALFVSRATTLALDVALSFRQITLIGQISAANVAVHAAGRYELFFHAKAIWQDALKSSAPLFLLVLTALEWAPKDKDGQNRKIVHPCSLRTGVPTTPHLGNIIK
jgi:hypothetical protein